jgi:biofilm protein TabA
MKKIIFFSITLVALLMYNRISAQDIPSALTGKSFHPHTTINKAEFARQYQLNKNYWDEAFDFLKNHKLDTMAVGRYIIDGDNVYAMITENPTKNIDSTKWESHRNYIDLQLVLTGEEKIGVADISGLSITMPYDASKDLQNYSGDGKFYTAEPGTFFLFFPPDAHRPNITTNGNKPDKKIVIKIRYAG